MHLPKKTNGRCGVPQSGADLSAAQQSLPHRGRSYAGAAKKATQYSKYTYIEYARFADDLVILIDAYPSPRRLQLHWPTANPGRAACVPVASYGQWSRVVREPLIWLAKPTRRTMERARDMDPEHAAARELVDHWAACLGLDNPSTAREIVQRACDIGTVRLKRPEFRELLLSQCGAGDRSIQGSWGSGLSTLAGASTMGTGLCPVGPTSTTSFSGGR